MKIAIIGTGISGLSAAYFLHPQHQITVYEQSANIGGHSRTLSIATPDAQVAVDTGFIVYNERNYPHLSALFAELSVPVAKSNMSFGVSIADGWLEYGTQRLFDLVAQKRNILRGAFWRMLFDIRRFNHQAKAYVDQYPKACLSECLDALAMGEWFRQFYLLAMAGAIWSAPRAQMLDFPAQTLINFFDNHGLLTVNDQPQWYTVVGGSRSYVARLSAPFKDKIHTACAVQRVQRVADGVLVTDQANHSVLYDQVVLACHSDQALRLLVNPTATESGVLGNIGYQSNTVVLHRDTQFMPRRRNAWASWIYLSDDRAGAEQRASLTYWMNNLQPLDTETPVLVTLNPATEPQADLIYDRHQFDHPVFNAAAIDAQSQIHRLQGQDRLWYCGAWQRYGFHEDGIGSAVNMVNAMGVRVPWQ